MFQWNYGIFSSTASSLVTTHLKVATGKVGVNLNVFGPNPVAHLLGGKFIRIAGEDLCQCKLLHIHMTGEGSFPQLHPG